MDPNTGAATRIYSTQGGNGNKGKKKTLVISIYYSKIIIITLHQQGLKWVFAKN